MAKPKKLVGNPGKYFYKKDEINDGIYFNSIPHYQSVQRFLEAVEKLAPEVIDDLYDIAPLYKKMCALATQKDTENSDERFQAEVNTYAAIFDWAKKYRLIDDDCRQLLYFEIAARALEVYCNPEKYEWYFTKLIKTKKGWKLELSDKPFIKLSDKVEHPVNNTESYSTLHKAYPFVFMPSGSLTIAQLDGEKEFLQKAESYEDPHDIHGEDAADSWDPCLESWSDFEERIDTFYVLYKAAYKKRMELAYQQAGYETIGEKRKGEHFEWFVLYQVKGWELAKVADYIEANDGAVVGEDTIYKAVKGIAELVGLPLREGYTKSKQNIT